VGTIDQMEEQSKWLTPEISSLLPFVYMPSGNLMEIAKEIFPNSTLLLSNLARLAASDTDKTVRRSVDRSLNLRSLQRLIHHSSTAGKPIRREVERMVLLPFLSPAVRLAVGNLLDGIDMHFHDITDPIVSSQVGNDYWQIGNNCYQRYQPKDLTLVPRVQFRENPGQLRVIAEIVRDLMEFHLPVLLIGNQGVGKNKIADYILQCLRRPRHYLQLHRDSSIYSLTQRTVLVDGQLRHEMYIILFYFVFNRIYLITPQISAC
jgi:hypothetical protein